MLAAMLGDCFVPLEFLTLGMALVALRINDFLSNHWLLGIKLFRKVSLINRDPIPSRSLVLLGVIQRFRMLLKTVGG